jgi:hypothetical protein
MASACFMKENSQLPPMCGVHNLALVLSELPIDPYAPHLGHITGYVCPVSGRFVEEPGIVANLSDP